MAAEAKKTKMQVVKRDGRVVAFEPKRIGVAIGKAVAETQEFDEKETKRLQGIAKTIIEKTLSGKTPSVEEIQDIVEQVLMAGGHYQTAKAYILYRERQREARRARGVLGVEDDLGLSINQLKVIERRYLLHDEDGKVIETPAQMFTRVAKTLAKVEQKERKEWEKKFFEVMSRMEFLPAGRTLNNAGTAQNQLANCFVLPVEDSIEGIFDAVKWTAMIHQTGGGTGFNFSKLRPMGDSVTKSAGGFATGPVSFMKVFDVATRQVMQGGKKRGANMGILNIDHPDIMEFITAKTEEGEIANFNISVGVTDEFMKAVRDDKEFTLRNPRTGEVVHEVSARMLMDQMTTLAWRTGDPGMIYLDAINRNNPLLEAYGRIEATNPCGEQPLHPFDACNLGSINLASFVTDGEVVWQRLGEVTRVAVRMLDNVIDACKYPLPQIDETVKANRRIGLGVMGWAHMLFKLGIGYNSEEAVALAEKVMGFIQKESWEASAEIAVEKGVFPRWKESAFAKGWDPLSKKYNKEILRLSGGANSTKSAQDDKAGIKSLPALSSKKHKLWRVRNVAITTIAPTGTISMAADTSSGIEPVFALSFVKNVVDEEGLTYVDPYFEAALRDEVGSNGEFNQMVGQITKEGSAQHVEGLSKQTKSVFVSAHDISWEWHVRMQAAFQKHTDNAVSKTINFPASAGIDEIMGAYLLSWELGCKGITVYRDSSKEYQVLSTAKSKEPTSKAYLIQSKLKVKTLKERKEEGTALSKKKGKTCPECGGAVTIQEGCSLCHSCGWSACSA